MEVYTTQHIFSVLFHINSESQKYCIQSQAHQWQYTRLLRKNLFLILYSVLCVINRYAYILFKLIVFRMTQ